MSAILRLFAPSSHRCCGNLCLLSSLAAVVVLLAGCGQTGRRACEVSGTVTINGTPIQVGQIDLDITEEGDLPSGASITNGAYRLMSTPGRKKVRVSALDPSTLPNGSNDGAKPDAKPTMAKSIVPEKYLKTPLIIEITKSGVYDIELTSD